MSVIYVVLPIAMLLLAGAIAAYAWAARKGQFDDLETPAMRALHDDDGTRTPSTKTSNPQADPPRTPQGNACFHVCTDLPIIAPSVAPMVPPTRNEPIAPGTVAPQSRVSQ